MSSSAQAQADDPVTPALRYLADASVYLVPAFAGMTRCVCLSACPTLGVIARAGGRPKLEINISGRRARDMSLRLVFVYLLDDAALTETCAGINKARSRCSI